MPQLPKARHPQRTGGGGLTSLTPIPESHRVTSATLCDHGLAQIPGP